MVVQFAINELDLEETLKSFTILTENGEYVILLDLVRIVGVIILMRYLSKTRGEPPQSLPVARRSSSQAK